MGREGLNFVCRVENPPHGEHALALAALGHSLASILQELTDRVVIRYLAGHPDLAVFEFAQEGE